MISKISDDIGAVLTDDIVNYTRNVVDVNTCKVPQLIEHGRMLKYGLDHLKNTYDFFPLQIRCLIDIFSINPEYLVGNQKNHILSDEVVKEILIYIRENSDDKTPFEDSSVVDRLIDDPHGLVDEGLYRNFIVELFYTTIVQALTATYNTGLHPDSEDVQPIVFNVLHYERKNQSSVLGKIKQHRSWVDRFISNEQEHPWNSEGMDMWRTVEDVKNTKGMSPKFNPFIVADEIFLHGLSPTNKLS